MTPLRATLLAAAMTATLVGCGDSEPAAQPSDAAKIDAAFARLGANPETVGQQKVIDGNFGPLDQVVSRLIYLVPKDDGKTYWIVDSEGEVFDGYYEFLRDNTLSR